MALSQEDREWIEAKRRKFEREERELKRRGIIPYTEDELEEINAKKDEMREQAELTAEALKKAGVSGKAKFGFNEIQGMGYGGSRGIDIFTNGVGSGGNTYGFGGGN